MQLEALQPGDIVDVVAPASQCSKAELNSGLKQLRDWGLIPRVPKNLFAKSLLFSNSDEERLKQLKKAIYATDSKMIWCVRGGYGAIRLMSDIERWSKPKRAKILLGYSDITTLHVHCNQTWKWPTIHGPLLDRVGRGDMSKGEERELLKMLFGESSTTAFKDLRPLNKAARQKRVIRAPILGGNMVTLQSSLGTPSQFRPKNCILFFEEIGERPHKVDRMLTQFAQAGWFKRARAVIFGHLLIHNALDRRGMWNDVIPRFANSVRIPVLCGLPSGHDPKSQFPLPFNTPSKLVTGGRAHLTVESGIRTP